MCARAYVWFFFNIPAQYMTRASEEMWLAGKDSESFIVLFILKACNSFHYFLSRRVGMKEGRLTSNFVKVCQAMNVSKVDAQLVKCIAFTFHVVPQRNLPSISISKTFM